MSIKLGMNQFSPLFSQKAEASMVGICPLYCMILQEMHFNVPSLTPEEERQAAELLKRAISTSSDKGVVQLATGRKCFDWY